MAAGCDAVYIGGSSFGARAYAENLSREDMVEAIGYCHLHGVKIYMTVNTLLKEEERRYLLYDYLLPYYRAGLDAVIVQDVGVMDFIREYFPELPIHASTQMAWTMGRGADLLKKYHVSRMVPARELSLEELRQMRRDTTLELEVFVHGALCYCYSGQCLFSSMLGGRSGNRGRCAQPCRLSYRGEQISREKGSYVLSPRELCNLAYIGELIEAGVDSFKIEGRMKGPEYTAFVTAVYRKYTDYYCTMGKQNYEEYLRTHQSEWQRDLRHLAELYNREGFTRGYLEGQTGNVDTRKPGRRGDMLSRMRPKHGGVLVGEVLSLSRREVTYRAVEEILPQDVVEFRDKQGRQTYEYTLGKRIAPGERVTARYQKGCRIRPGDKVYRTRHGVLLDEIRKNYLEREQKEPVQGMFTGAAGQPMTLTLQQGEDVVCCQGEVCQPAKNQPSSREMVEKSLKQTGGSPFFFDKLTLEMEEGLFLSVGALKKLRRQAFEELREKMAAKYYRNTEKSYAYDRIVQDTAEESKPPEAAVSVMNLSQLEAVLEREDVKRVYLYTDELSFRQIRSAREEISCRGKEACLALPRIFRQGVWRLWEAEEKREDSLLSLPWSGYLVKNWESLHFLREQQVPSEQVVLDYSMYVMNEGSYAFWQREGVNEITLPLELTEEELGELSFLSRGELLVYTRVPLMVTAQCMPANTEKCVAGERAATIYFEDSKGRRFFSRNYCRYCYNVIYQQEPMILQPRQWKRLPVGRVRYDFVNEAAGEIREILGGNTQMMGNEGHWRLGIR